MNQTSAQQQYQTSHSQFQINNSQINDFKNYCQQNNITLSQITQDIQDSYFKNPILSQQKLKITINLIQNNGFQQFDIQKNANRLYMYYTTILIQKITHSTHKKATNYLAQAKKLLLLYDRKLKKPSFQLMFIWATLSFHVGHVSKAINILSKIIEIIAQFQNQYKQIMSQSMVLMAQCYFAKKQYYKAIQWFQKILNLNKYLPLDCIMALGFCFYNEDQYELAQQCFIKVLQKDPMQLNCLIGLALVYYKNQQFLQYFQLLKQIKEQQNNQDPTALLLLAQHYSIMKKHDQLQRACLKGIMCLNSWPKVIQPQNQIRNDYQQILGRFQGLLGQSYMIQGDYKTANNFYSLKAAKKHLWNRTNQVRSHANLKQYREAYAIMEQIYAGNYYVRHGKYSKDRRFLYQTHKLAVFVHRRSFVGYAPCTDTTKTSHPYTSYAYWKKKDLDVWIQLIYYLADMGRFGDLTAFKSSTAGQAMPIAQAQKIILSTQDERMAQIMSYHAASFFDFNTTFTDYLYMKECLDYIGCKNIDENQKIIYYCVAYYNIALIYQRKDRQDSSKTNTHLKYDRALKIYQDLIGICPYFLDPYLRVANIYYTIGSQKECFQYLQLAENISLSKTYSQRQKIYILRAYYLFCYKKYKQAYQQIKLIENRTIYQQILELSIDYHYRLPLITDTQKRLQFLSQRQDILIKICKENVQAVYAFQTLIIYQMAQGKVDYYNGKIFWDSLRQGQGQTIVQRLITYNSALFFLNKGDINKAHSNLTSFNNYAKQLQLENILLYDEFLDKKYTQVIHKLKILDGKYPKPQIKHAIQIKYVQQKLAVKLFKDQRFSDQMQKDINLLTQCQQLYQQVLSLNQNSYKQSKYKELSQEGFLNLQNLALQNINECKQYIILYKNRIQKIDLKQEQKRKSQVVKKQPLTQQGIQRQLRQYHRQREQQQKMFAMQSQIRQNRMKQRLQQLKQKLKNIKFNNDQWKQRIRQQIAHMTINTKIKKPRKSNRVYRLNNDYITQQRRINELHAQKVIKLAQERKREQQLRQQKKKKKQQDQIQRKKRIIESTSTTLKIYNNPIDQENDQVIILTNKPEINKSKQINLINQKNKESDDIMKKKIKIAEQDIHKIEQPGQKIIDRNVSKLKQLRNALKVKKMQQQNQDQNQINVKIENKINKFFQQKIVKKQVKEQQNEY